MPEKIGAHTRSRMMAGIRSVDTRPEMAVRTFLHREGFRFRLHGKGLPGRPDVVLPRWKAVIFVHGCFWHGHVDCRYFKIPKTRTEFWVAKINANRIRDARAIKSIANAGWRVFTIWECAIRNEPVTALNRLAAFIRTDTRIAEIAAGA